MDLIPLLDIVLALAMALWVPLLAGAAFGRGPQAGGPWSRALLWGAGIAAGLGMAFAPGSLWGLALALPWFLGSLGLALMGARRLALWAYDDGAQAAVGLGALLLPVGSVWMLATHLSAPFLGFAEPWKVLTAIHFHYSAFLTLVACGLLMGRLPAPSALRRNFAWALPFYVLGLMLVAVGLQGHRTIEVTGVTVLVSAGLLILGSLLGGSKDLGLSTTRLIVLRFALVAGCVGFSFALLYQLRLPWLQAIDQMLATHGLLQAGLLVPGLVLSALALPPSPRSREDIPFSRLKAAWTVGPDYFRRLGAGASGPRGLVDDFAAFKRRDFDPARVPKPIADFYENTLAYRLDVRVKAAPWFASAWAGPVGRAFKAMQQLNLPSTDETMLGSLCPIPQALDGRVKPRGWVRVDAQAASAVYVAAYAIHQAAGETFMNISFPLPFSNMTSILQVRHLDEVNGLRLSSRLSATGPGHQGVYLVFQGLGLRLPLDETIDVWLDGELRAQHKMWFFGVEYLCLDYFMVKQGGAPKR